MTPPELPFVEFIPHAAFKEDMRSGGRERIAETVSFIHFHKLTLRWCKRRS